MGGTVLSSFCCKGSSLTSPVLFPFASSVTVYNPGPLPIFTVAPPVPPLSPGVLWGALTGGVPGSLTWFLNCRGNPNVSLTIPVVHLAFFGSRCWLPSSDIFHCLHGSLSFLGLPALWCGGPTDRGTWLNTWQTLILLSGAVVGDPLGLLH